MHWLLSVREARSDSEEKGKIICHIRTYVQFMHSAHGDAIVCSIPKETQSERKKEGPLKIITLYLISVMYARYVRIVHAVVLGNSEWALPSAQLGSLLSWSLRDGQPLCIQTIEGYSWRQIVRAWLGQALGTFQGFRSLFSVVFLSVPCVCVCANGLAIHSIRD